MPGYAVHLAWRCAIVASSAAALCWLDPHRCPPKRQSPPTCATSRPLHLPSTSSPAAASCL